MIIENAATEIGDVILIKSEVPILGLIALQDFYDSTGGETGSKFFTREFRYSIDGINYTEWIELTIPNIQDVLVESTDTFFIEYHYERTGADPSGSLTFENNTLQGDYTPLSCGTTYENSFFSEFFSCFDIDLYGWVVNVLEKIYQPGIIPEYIERGGRGNYNRDDQDFIDFWKNVSWFFAIFVRWAREIENLRNNETILKEYLNNLGIYLCQDEDLEDLLYIMQNFYHEITERGTKQIIKKKADGEDVNGELLRLICYDSTCDEFILDLVPSQNLGWNVGNSSPLYRGTSFDFMTIKAYETSESVQSLDNYPLINDSYCSIVDDGGVDVIKIGAVPTGIKSGIHPGSESNPLANIDKAIIINTNLDYEITFWLKQEAAEDVLTFQVWAIDTSNQTSSLYLRSIDISDTFTRELFEKKSLIQNDRYYFVRGIIYASGTTLVTTDEAKLNIGFGNNLRFEGNICKIIPEIVVDNISGSGATTNHYIKDFKVRPLNTEYSTGFVQTRNFFKIWLQNNNRQKSELQLEDIMREYLLPYDSTFQNQYL